MLFSFHTTIKKMEKSQKNVLYIFFRKKKNNKKQTKTNKKQQHFVFSYTFLISVELSDKMVKILSFVKLFIERIYHWDNHQRKPILHFVLDLNKFTILVVDLWK
jgi:hypothetical protein